MYGHAKIGLGALLIVLGLTTGLGTVAAAGSQPVLEDEVTSTANNDPDPQPAAETHECSGIAPIDTMCSTGTFTFGGGGGHGILSSEYDVSTYQLESRLVHDSGEDRYLRCTFVAGQVESCGTGGDWPDPGVEFEHVCTVEWPTEEMPVQEGGFPDFGCLVMV